MATSMADLLRMMESYDYIRCTMADMNGVARCKILPRAAAKSVLPHNRLHMYSGTTLFGVHGAVPLKTLSPVIDIGFINAVFVADPSSFHELPWAEQPEARVAEVYGETSLPTAEGQLEPQSFITRHAARTQLQRLADRGFSLLAGSEMEFKLFHKDTHAPVCQDLEFCNQLILADVESTLFTLERNLRKVGVITEAIHNEYSPSQFEFVLQAKNGIQPADDVFLFKGAAKEICKKEGLIASFFGKDSPTGAGTGTHFNASLWDMETKLNLFYDSSSSDNLSEIARQWIAGLVAHADALTALCCPTVNCYRRLHQPWSPCKADWGYGHRMMAFRTENKGEKGPYIENRLPSGLANPYLVMAATVAAGLDGIEKGMTCPPDKQKDAAPLPFNLKQAMDALAKDTVLRNALGDNLIDSFIGIKTETELEMFKEHDPANNDVAHFLAERAAYEPYM